MGQVNLVMNPSLEQYSICPDRWDEIKYADFWMSLDSAWSPPDWTHVPWGVPEYFNACSHTGGVGVPLNPFCYQYPHSGNGMAFVQMFYDLPDPNSRDYMQGHLKSTLIAGQTYCVSFFVVSSESSWYAIENISAYLDDGTIDTTVNHGLPQTHCIPQVTASSIINDTLHWIRIQGSFVANGTERLITIGNFSDNAHTTVIVTEDTTGTWMSGGAVSWYLVDDVSVMAVDATINAGADRVITGTDSVTIGDTLDSYLPTYWYANGSLIDSNTAWLRVRPDTTTMYVVELSRCGGDNITDTVWVYAGALGAASPIGSFGAVKLLPNPAQDILTVSGAAGGELFIFDMVGREVLRSSLLTNNMVVDISGLLPGVYMAQVVMPDGGRTCVRVMVN